MTDLDRNLDKLQGFLSRFQRDGIRNRIAGKDQDGSGENFTNESPVDQSQICQVARSDASDVHAAAQAASDAFADWRDIGAKERRKILINIAKGIEAVQRRSRFVNVGIQGKPCALCPRRHCAGQRIFDILRIRLNKHVMVSTLNPVSYTHLTLPTILLV